MSMEWMKEIEHEVSSWPGISVHPHRFGGNEFRFGHAEVGHIHHHGGMVDIPFPRSIRDALLEEALAEEHHWVPNSGWTTFRIRDEEGFKHARWLLRLSYLRYALKTALDPHQLFGHESKELRLTPRFRSLLEQFVPSTAQRRSAESLTA
jgi:Family of unknown function (DUF5519)